MPLFATAYFAPIAYYAKLAQYETVFIEQMETFPKQTYRNRTVIATANGLLPLIVPIIRTNGNHTLTKDIVISYKENWNIRHLRAIESAYNASPYFLYYRDAIEKILLSHYERLIDLNNDLTNLLLKKLKVESSLIPTKDFEPTNTTKKDYRWSFSVKDSYTTEQFPAYDQVFAANSPFYPNISILDLLFNLGPEAKDYLASIKI